MIGAGGSSAAGSPGAGGVSGIGGATGRGGDTGRRDAAAGASGADGKIETDTPLGTGGIVGLGGGPGPDGPINTGGINGTGGETKADASPGTGGSTSGKGGSSPDAPAGTGGVGSGGATTGTGGKVGTGGAGTGGTVGTGGAGTGGATGTGGSTGYNCASAIVPASGYVTDFTDWNATTSRWGKGTLIGTIVGYASTSPAATMTAKVEGTPPGLHLVGSTSSTGYAGGILTFLSCVTTASFTKISFDVYGSASGCTIDLQLQTFDQRPNNATPPGSCDPSGTCYTFPHTNLASGTLPSTTPKTVTTTLNTMTNWTTAEGAQIVGVQWQFTGNPCTPGATFTNIKFQ